MADSKNWRDWLRYAENNRKLAERGLDDLPAPSAYLLHQASEKYLKAVLVQRGLEPPQTHDPGRLLGQVEPGLDASSPETRAAILLFVLMPTNRYPGNLPEPTAAEARALERAAGVLRTFARIRLGLQP